MKTANHPSNHRILLIDDNRSIHDDFRKILTGDDVRQSAMDESRADFFGEPRAPKTQPVFELDSAYQGEEGVAMLLRSLEADRPYAMAFIDMRMPPGIDGLETAAKLWEICPELQIVICTAYSDYSWEEMVAKIDNSDRLLILKKPFEAIEVIQFSHALTRKWELAQALTTRLASLEVLVGERTCELAEANRQLHIDIAERKRSNERMRRLFASNAQGIAFWSTNGIITEANDAFLCLVGYSRESLAAGRLNWRELTPPEYARMDERALREIAATGVCTAYEKEYLRKDGTRVPILLGAAAFESTPDEGVCFVLDLSERKALETQFFRAQRLESLGTLAAGIAHDLNNTFAPITTAIDLLRLEVHDPANLELLDIAETSAWRGAGMVRQVLSFARGLDGDRVALKPMYLIEEVRKIAADTFPKNLDLKTDIAPNLWEVLGDSTQLHQVLLNLCVNARDAMPDGGVLSISAANVTLDEHYAAMHREATAGAFVRLEVRDSGAGIPAHVLEKIFDPFFTTKEIGKGTGLGLSTSLGIVKSHGGFICVASKPGKGAVFQVYLPAEDRSQLSEPVVRVPEAVRGRGECVLVIDDEEPIRAVTRRALEAFGYRVLTAADGVEAIALYVQHAGDIAVVLTDMMMPVMDGPATIAILRRLNSEVKIIVASGLNSHWQAVSALSGGPFPFLPKPYAADALLRVLAEVLERPLDLPTPPREATTAERIASRKANCAAPESRWSNRLEFARLSPKAVVPNLEVTRQTAWIFSRDCMASAR